ncbi:MAG: hypothetical protein ACXAB8_01070 [Promethearchaeota archaeon]|jgi:deoxyadenosine/deoxycytidine kinase
MSELTQEEKFIIEKLKENGGQLNYKELQNLCQDEFEGVRLILYDSRLFSRNNLIKGYIGFPHPFYYYKNFLSKFSVMFPLIIYIRSFIDHLKNRIKSG